MPDSHGIEAEPARQQPFIFGALWAAALLASVLLFDSWLLTVPDRNAGGPPTASIRFDPVMVKAPRGLRLAGAWRVTSDDPRFGGLSALAFDGARLVALSDSGMVARFKPPFEPSRTVELRDLPAGPGSGGFKRNRDSEALLGDPAGRGWWIAFERHHQLWLYDANFRRALRKLVLPAGGWGVNGGVEALAAVEGDLLLFPESLQGGLKLREGRARHVPVRGLQGALTDAASLGGGWIIALERKATLRGFENRLVWLKRRGGNYAVVQSIALPIGRFDNAEGLAIEPWPAGWSRLWVVTDDNFQPPLRTLLLAVDLPPP